MRQQTPWQHTGGCRVAHAGAASKLRRKLGRKGVKAPDSRTAAGPKGAASKLRKNTWPKRCEVARFAHCVLAAGPDPPPLSSLHMEEAAHHSAAPSRQTAITTTPRLPAAPTHHRADAPLQGPTYAAIHASTHHLHKRVHARSRAPDDHGRTWPAGASPHDRPDTSLEPSAEN